MAFARTTTKNYFDFSGGFNDTTQQDMLQDNELSECENLVLNQIGALTVRSGTSKINATSRSANITRRWEYLIRDNSNILEVRSKTLYRIKSDGTETQLQVLVHDKPYFNQQQDIVYISDGNEIYELGGKDYFSNSGTKVNIKVGDVVQIADSYTANTNIIGKFYKSLVANSSCNLTTEDYTVTTNWQDVTDVNGSTSTVFRALKAYDGSKEEILRFSFFGDLTVVDNTTCNIGFKRINYSDTDNPVTISRAYTASGGSKYVASKTKDMFTNDTYNTSDKLTSNWKTELEENILTIVNKSKGKLTYDLIPYTCRLNTADNTINSEDCGISIVKEIVQRGTNNDNILSQVKKCRMIIQHNQSGRYVAAGNPDKPYMIYFSEPFQMNYWKELNQLFPTSSEGLPVCMINIIDSLLISFKNSWWEYTGYNPAKDGTWKRLAIPDGCVSEFSIQVLDLYNFVYLSNTDLNIVNVDILRQEGVVFQNKNSIKSISTDKIKNTINSMKHKSECTSIYYNNKYYLAYSDETTFSGNNKVITYNQKHNSFHLYSGIRVNDFLIKKNKDLEFASLNYALKFDDTLLSDVDVLTGEPKKIYYKFKTSNLALGNYVAPKFIDKFFIKVIKIAEADESKIRMVLKLDTKEMDISLLYNKDLPGNGMIGLQGGYIRKKATNVSVEITNKNTSDNFTNDIIIHGFSISFVPKIAHQKLANNKFSK